jgi:hypothetical protein
MSYVRLTTFELSTPRTLDEIKVVVDELNQEVKKNQDLEFIHYFVDSEAGKYGAVSYYKTKEGRENAGAVLTKIVREHLGNELKGAPTTQFFDDTL